MFLKMIGKRNNLVITNILLDNAFILVELN
jgi:hypothetical protein